MRYGLSLPNGGVCGDARILAELGCLAEEAGWDGVFVEDYIVHQSDGAVPTCDPWIAWRQWQSAQAGFGWAPQ